MTFQTVRAQASGKEWPFGPLVPFSYDFLMADPPWPTVMRSPKGDTILPNIYTAGSGVPTASIDFPVPAEPSTMSLG